MSRSVAYPLLALLALAVVAAANVAVYQAGAELFVARPDAMVPVRNVLATAVILIGGWLLIPSGRRLRGAETMLAVAATLFGIGAAVQFRLGYDAPRQLTNSQVDAVRDSVSAALPSAPDSVVRREVRAVVLRRNGELRRNFEASRVDTRLARALEAAYGPSADTRPVLDERRVGPGDSFLFRMLPALAALLGVGLSVRADVARAMSRNWRAIGFFGSLAMCGITLGYLLGAGGVRGANFAPQEILKITLPIAWAGLLIHYRSAFLKETRERFARSPVVLWLYTLLLLSSPLAVFVVVRDFGQFLVLSIAQTLLLAYYTRSALYIVLFLAGTLASSAILLGSEYFPGTALLTVLAIVVGAVLAAGALERFRRRDALWAPASAVLALYTGAVYLAVQLPFVAGLLRTPRQRFLLWADLFARRGDSMWWDSSRQIVEALYAFQAGGIGGEGLGLGTPFLIPKAASDFIFAAIAEELGFAGALLIVLSYVALVAIGLRLASAIGRDTFGGLLVAGLTILLGTQAFVHIAGTMNVLPMTGITLPLVSSGMSSLVVSWLMVGAILGLSSHEINPGEKLRIVKRAER